MAKMKPGQISAKRAYEISDSLRKRAEFDGKWAKATGNLASYESNQSTREALLKNSAQNWRSYTHNYEKADRLTSRADAAMAKANRQNFGSTDCALPMIWASKNKHEYDAFIVITDNETYYGSTHPKVALDAYRKSFVKDARQAVLANAAFITPCSRHLTLTL